MSGWTHVICVACYEEKAPLRTPVKLRDPPLETCCFCGRATLAGIYYRAAPVEAPRCPGHDD